MSHTYMRQKFLDLLPTAELVTERSSSQDSDPNDPSTHKKIEKGAVDSLLELLAEDPLYISIDDGASHIFRKGKLFRLSTKNQELYEDLKLEGHEYLGKPPSRESVSTVIELKSALARRTGEPVELFNRIGERENKFFYNLGDNRAVEISAGSWKIVDSPVMFRVFKDQNIQAQPDPKNGDACKILEFLLLKEDQRLLFMVALITSFIPRIAHPALHLCGSQGAGKSFVAKLIKEIIDPSSGGLSMMPRKSEDLDLLIFKKKCLVLDNLSGLNFDTCDRLCSMISGGSIERRTLHTDLETQIFTANPILIYSSIGSLHSRPDLTERTISIELQRIKDSLRKEEGILLEEFRDALPVILGGIFDVLSHAMAVFEDYPLKNLPRMAEFARWGYVIAECLGESGEQFLSDYAGNADTQTSELIEKNTLFASIVEAMNQPDRESLSGSFMEVLSILMEVIAPGEAASGYKSLAKDKTFPSPRAFRNHLERIRIPLENFNISYRVDTHRTASAKAFVQFKKIPDPDKIEVLEDVKDLNGIF